MWLITGIRYDTQKPHSRCYTVQKGYVIAIDKNPLIQTPTQAQAIANIVGAKIVGMRFRPLSHRVFMTLSIEGGDIRLCIG